MCIDDFLGFYVNQKVYPDFWYVFEFAFTLSHGQSAVDYVFNINRHNLLIILKIPTSLHCVQYLIELFIMVVLDHSRLIIFCCYLATLLLLDTRMTWRKEGRNLQTVKISRNKNSWARSCES